MEITITTITRVVVMDIKIQVQKSYWLFYQKNFITVTQSDKVTTIIMKIPIT